MWLVVGLPFDSATRRCWDATNSQYAWGLRHRPVDYILRMPVSTRA